MTHLNQLVVTWEHLNQLNQWSVAAVMCHWPFVHRWFTYPDINSVGILTQFRTFCWMWWMCLHSVVVTPHSSFLRNAFSRVLACGSCCSRLSSSCFDLLFFQSWVRVCSFCSPSPQSDMVAALEYGSWYFARSSFCCGLIRLFNRRCCCRCSEQCRLNDVEWFLLWVFIIFFVLFLFFIFLAGLV